MIETATEVREKLGAMSDSPTDAPDKATPLGSEGAAAATDIAGAGELTGDKGVSPETAQALIARLQEASTRIRQLEGVQAKVERIEKAFSDPDKPAELSDRDKAILAELHRLVPGLKHVEDIPKLKEALTTAGAAAQEGMADAAWAYQLTLQKESGVGADDGELNEMIGVNIREWVKKEPERLKRYFRGDKDVIREGYEAVTSKLFGPARLAKKREMVVKKPVVPGARGSSGGPGGTVTQVDFSDRKAVRSALRAALASGEE